MKRVSMVLSVAAVALMMHGAAFAQSGPKNGGVKVNGFAANTTVANGNANVTSGLLNVGKQNIGAIAGGTEVNGFLANTTVANGNANVTTGLLNKGCQNVGYVGELDC